MLCNLITVCVCLLLIQMHMKCKCNLKHFLYKYFIFQLMHSIIWIVGLLKTHYKYKICSDMFRYTQEPSSGSQSQCLAKITGMVPLCLWICVWPVLWWHIPTCFVCVCVDRTAIHTHTHTQNMVAYSDLFCVSVWIAVRSTHTHKTGRNMPP